MPTKDDDMIATTDRRKMSLIEMAKKCGAIILSNGEMWNGDERREDGKADTAKPSKDLPAQEEKAPCDFFG